MLGLGGEGGVAVEARVVSWRACSGVGCRLVKVVFKYNGLDGTVHLNTCS